MESLWAAQRSVSMARPLLTFPIACDHILQRPQYRMKTVLEKQAWKKDEGERTVWAAKTRRGGGGGGRNRKRIKMQNSSGGICEEGGRGEIQDARRKEMKKQKCMSSYGACADQK